MTPSGLIIKVHEPDLICITGELDVATTPQLHVAIAKLHAASDGASRDLRIDAAGVSFCDSTGIGALIWAHNTYAGDSGHIVLVNPSPTLQRLIQLTGLHDILPTAHDGSVDTECRNRP